MAEQAPTTTPEGAAPPGDAAATAQGAPPPAAPPEPTIQWDAPIRADDAPSVFKPYAGKPISAVAEEFHRMRQTLSERDAKIAELNKAMKAPAADPKKAEPEAPKTVTAEEAQQAYRYYLEHGEVNADFAKAVERDGMQMPADMLLRNFESWRRQRQQFAELAEEKTGGIKLNDLDEWLSSGTSPFSEAAIRTFQEEADKGETYWLERVANEYRKHFGETSPTPAQGRFRSPEMRQGQPAVAVPQIFMTRSEARNAIASTDDPAESAKIIAKMTESENYFASRGQAWPEE